MADEQFVRTNGVDLCAQTFGDRTDPAILLISGAASSMDWWEDEFCERLAAGHRYVVRYDLRDTGRSTSYEPGAPKYTSHDLIADAVGLLDALGLASAHIVGISMGGGIAQYVAAGYPERVATLTLLSTSPAGRVGRDLPPMSDKLRARLASPPAEPDWSDRAAVIDYTVDNLRAFAGSHPFEEERVRDLAGRIFDRTVNIEASSKNHWILPGDDDHTGPRLGQVAAPTLVMHGTEDPLFPYGHAEALAGAIPDARLIPLEGVGHEVPPRPVWDIVLAALTRHTSGR